MTSPDHEERTTGPRAAAISNMMVQLLHTYTGRGPTRARTTIGDQVVVCVLADTLTKSESKLVAAGEEQLVLDQRSAFQRLMRDEAVTAVEQITGRGVAAFMSNNHIEPDLAVETFVLEPGSDGHLVGEPKHRQAGDQHGRWPE
jgi:uncharacterized protein YbcI